MTAQTTAPAAADLMVVETKNGVRVHKATCKKLPAAAVPMTKVGGFAAGALVLAKPASCCKPKIQVAIGEVMRGEAAPAETAPVDHEPAVEEGPLTQHEVNLEEQGLAEEDLIGDPSTTIVAPKAEVAAEKTADPKPAKAPAAKPAKAQPAAKVAPVKEPTNVEELKAVIGNLKISKHYHAALVDIAAPLIFEKDGEDWLVTELLVDAFKSLSTWRRQDEDYKALPPQDVKWYTSARYAWERDYLVNFVRGALGLKTLNAFGAQEAAKRGRAAGAAHRKADARFA